MTTQYDDVFEIPANTLMIMGPKLYKLFRAASCIPRCHSCREWIDKGAEFQLLELDGTDHMVCNKTRTGYPPGGGNRRELYCGDPSLLKARLKELEPKPPRVGGGFSRPITARTQL